MTNRHHPKHLQRQSGRWGVALTVASAALVLLAGCGTVPTEPSSPQRVRVETPGCAEAQCMLSNDRGHWTVDPTPGEVEIMASTKPLEVACRARDESSAISAPSELRPVSPAATAIGGAAGAGAAAAYVAPMASFAPVLAGFFVLYSGAMAAGAARAVDASARTVSYPTELIVPLRCDRIGIDATALANAPLGIAVRVAAGDDEPRDAAIVFAVAEAGRAVRAGLRVGDAIVSANDQAINGPATLEEIVRRAPAAAPLALGVLRGGQRTTVIVEPRVGP